MHSETMQSYIDCQDIAPQPITDTEFQTFIDALDADRRLTRAEVTIATALLHKARNCGYADVSILELSEIGRVAIRSAALVKKRLVQRGYFLIQKNGTERRNRFLPLRVPIRTMRRSRL